MKQYTGTKTVKAVPMTYGETHERGLIRENAYVEEYNDNKGYHVIYPDGYESWSPAEVFEDAYKLSETPSYGRLSGLLRVPERLYKNHLLEQGEDGRPR